MIQHNFPPLLALEEVKHSKEMCYGLILICLVGTGGQISPPPPPPPKKKLPSKSPALLGLKVNFLNIHHTADIIFFLICHVGKTPHLMYKKLNSFVYIFVVSCWFFQNNSSRICPVKLKIGMFYHMNNVIRLTVF